MGSYYGYIRYNAGSETRTASVIPDGSFSTLTVLMDNVTISSVEAVGVQFDVTGTGGDTAYIDAVNW